jgi:translation initiation factor IF-3
VKHIEKFISKNDKVKITMVFRGREFTLQEQANAILDKITSMTAGFAVVDQAPKFEGRFITMLLGPK